MAYNTAQGRAEYTATATQTAFAYSFKAYNTTDIIVFLTPTGQIPNDETDILTITTDYTVTIDGDNGGTVTLVNPATSGDSVTLQRSLPITRETDYQTNGDLLAETLDDDQNYQTYLVADAELNTSDRSLTIPASLQGFDTAIPNPVAEGYIRFAADGNSFVNDDTAPQFVTDAGTSATASEVSRLASEAAQGLSEDARDISITKASEASASAAAAALSESNIDPTNLLHTVGNGGGNPEGYTKTESDTNLLGISNVDQTKLGSLTIGESISVTAVSNDTTAITLTIASHNAKVGDTIYVSGLDFGNGTFTVSSVTSTTIVYASTELAATVTSALVEYGELKSLGAYSLNKIIQGTAIATTSGTSFDFTGIPSWAKKITLMLDRVSSVDKYIVQVGDGAIVTTGYGSTATYHVNNSTVTTNYTTGFMTYGADSFSLISGQLTLNLIGNNTWIGTATTAQTGTARTSFSAGSSPVLAGSLDRIRFTTLGGVATFSLGSINILVEG